MAKWTSAEAAASPFFSPAFSLLALAGCYDGANQRDCSQRGTASIPGCFDY
jgi:hypothetical protein